MLIFDSFKSKEDAKEFAATMRGAIFCETREESDKIDPFPFGLVEPIVLVPRSEEDDPEVANRAEGAIIKCADIYGGAFAGT